MSLNVNPTRSFVARLLGALVLVLAVFADPSAGSDRKLLTSDDLRILGVALRAEPATQRIPLGVPTSVKVPLVAAGDPTQIVPLGDLPADMVVRAQLEVPGLAAPLQLAAAPGASLGIPALGAEGTYKVVNIRLMQGDAVLMYAVPPAVEVVVGQILVTSVTSRTLTLEEVRDLGIVLDPSSFKVMNFSVSLGLSTGAVQIHIPALVPLNGGPVLALPRAMSPLAIGPLAEGPKVGVPTPPREFEIVPFALGETPGGPSTPGLSLSGAVVLPQSIGFLRQFHSVVLMVTNAAADTSTIAVRDLEATFVLPKGLLRRKSVPLTVGDVAVPVRVAGADEKLGTADDLNIIAAGFTASSELVTQGMEEGTHRIDIELAGTVTGLPDGDAPITGKASGIVLVRNPNFNLTFLVPSVVEAGREFEFSTVITNTSDLVANLVSLRLPASSAAGATLLSAELQTFETIEPGESVTARYRLRALRSGAISATRFGNADAALDGRFELKVTVNEDGFPTSPDVIHLPVQAYQLPPPLVDALLSFLGSMWSNATAPAGALAPGTPQVGREDVRRAAMQIADAGQRFEMGEPLVSVLSHLWLRFGGAERGSPTLDELRRGSLRWPEARTVLAEVLVAKLKGGHPARDLARAAASDHYYLAPFLYAGVDSSSGSARVLVVDSAMRGLGGAAAESAIPTGDVLDLGDDGQLAQVSAPAGVHSVFVEGVDAGVVDLTFIVPFAPAGGGQRLREVRFDDVSLATGEQVSITFDPSTESYTLVREGAAAVAGVGVEIATPDLALRSARVAPSIDPGHHVMALLFNRPVDEASAKLLASYAFEGEAMAEQAVTSALVQAAGRFVYLSLRNPVPPQPISRIRVTGVRDADHGPAPLMIQAIEVPPIGDGWGTVSGRALAGDGRPVAGLPVYLSEQVATTFGGRITEQTTSLSTTDGGGRYQFHFARKTGLALTVRAWDARGELAEAIATLRTDRQQLELDLRFLGRGTVTGWVATETGAPVAEALVTGIGRRPSDGQDDFVQEWSDSRGRFTLENLPVGTINLSVKTRSGLFAARSLLIPEAGARVDVGEIRLQSRPTGGVRGRVLDDRIPVVGAPVTIRSDAFAPDVWGTWALTDVDGSYAFPDVPVGQAVVEAIDLSTGVICARALGRVDKDLELALDLFCLSAETGTGTVNGLLLDSGGRPLSGWRVDLEGAPPQTSAEGTGRFQFDDVPLGIDKVVASEPAPGNRILEGSYDLRYAGQTQSLVMRLPAVGTLEFQATYQGGPAVGAIVGIRYSTLGCVTNRDGRCDLVVGVGGYLVDVAWQPPTIGKGDPPLPVAALVSATVRFDGDVRRVTAELPARHTLIGSVHSSGGAPEGGALVHLDELGIEDGSLVTIGLRSLPSDPVTGAFSFPNVMAGSFRLWAESAFGGDFAEATGVMGPGTKPVKLVFGAPPPSIALTVHVVRPDGGELVVPPGDLSIVVKRGPDSDLFDKNDPIATIPAGVYQVDVTYTLGGGIPQQLGTVVGTARADTTVTVRLVGHGVVRGVVRDAKGAPRGGAAVGLRSLSPGFHPEDYLPTTSALSDGSFEFLGVREGVIHLQASSAGMDGASSGSLTAGGSTDLDVTFGPTATIFGWVLSPDGSRAGAGLPIVLKHYGHDFGWTPIDGSLTDADGAFVVGPVPIGGRSYRVVATDQTTGRSASVELRPTASGPVPPVELHLGRVGAAHGFVFDADGTTPLVNTNVELQAGSMNPEMGARSLLTSVDPVSGYYRFDGVAEGPFSERARKPSTRLSACGAGNISLEDELVNVDLTLEPHGAVTGRLWSDGVPVEKAGANIKLHYPLGFGSDQRFTDASGRFEFDHVPLGKYTLVAEYVHPGDTRSDSGSASGELTAQGEVWNQDIDLNGFAKLTVNVVDDLGHKIDYPYEVTVGHGVKGAEAQSRVETTGTFEFARVRRGLVQIWGGMPDPLDPSNRASGSIEIPAGATDLVYTLQVSPVAGLEGIVLGVDGVPLGKDAAFVKLTVVPGAPRSVERYVVRTEADGSFEFDQVVAVGDLTLDVEPLVGAGRARAHYAWAAVPASVTLQLDVTPPVLVSSTPADGAIEVPIDAPLVLVFNEPMDAPALAPHLGRVVIDGVKPSAVVVDGATVTVTPAGLLATNRAYTLLVRAAAENVNGLALGVDRTVRFTTVDEAPPTAFLESPLVDAEAVPVGNPVTVRFSERIKADTIAGLSIQCAGVPQGSFALDETGTLASRVGGVLPIDVLPIDSACSVHASTALTDLYGNKLQKPLEFGFATEDTIVPELSPLEVTSPLGLSAYVEGALIQMQATPVDPTDVQRIDYYVLGKLEVTATLAPFAATIVVPSKLVAEGDDFIVHAIASDDVGNQSVKAEKTLKIEADAPPTVSILSPTDGTKFALGQRIPVSVKANDDLGIVAISYQVDFGGNIGGGTRAYKPAAKPGATATFEFTTPADFETGDLYITASATDTTGQTTWSAATRVSLLETAYEGFVWLPGGIKPATNVNVTIREQSGTGLFTGSTNGDGHYQIGVTTGEHHVAAEEVTAGVATGRRGRLESVQILPADIGKVKLLDPITLSTAGSIQFDITASGNPPSGPVTIQINTPYGQLTAAGVVGSHKAERVPFDFISILVRSDKTGYTAPRFYPPAPSPYVDGATIDVAIDLAEPVITSVNPDIAPAGRAFTLDVEGSRLHKTATVWIAGVEQSITWRNDHWIQVLVEKRNPGQSFSVEVRNPDGGIGTSDTIEVKARLLGLMASGAVRDLAARDGRVYTVGSGLRAYILDNGGEKLTWLPPQPAFDPFYQLALAGDWAFAAENRRVQLLQVSGAAVPVLVDAVSCPDLGGSVTDLVAAGPSEVWAVVGQRMIRLTVDKTAGPSPKLVAHVESPIHLGISGVRARLVGRRLYVASAPSDRVGGIRIFDVSDPERPTLLGEHEGQYGALVVSGDWVIAATVPTWPAKPKLELELLDASRPDAIEVLATVTLAKVATDLVVSRGQVFVADDSTSVPVYTLDYGAGTLTPATPLALATGSGGIESLLIDDSILYAGTGSGLYGFEPFELARTPLPWVVARNASPLAGGSAVIVAGDDLVADTDTTVTFADTLATELFVGDGWLSAQAPAGADGPATIRVTNPTGHWGEPEATLEYTDQSRLFGFAPAADSALGGKRLRLDGVGLMAETKVDIGGSPPGSPPLDFDVVSGTVAAPARIAGSYDVELVGQAAILQRFQSTSAKYDFEREGPLVYGAEQVALRGNPGGSIDVAAWGAGRLEMFELAIDGRVSGSASLYAGSPNFYGDLLVAGTTFLDASDPANIVTVNAFKDEFWGGASAGMVRFEGDRMYTGSYGCVYDVADPTAIARLGCLFQGLGDFVVDGGWVYRVAKVGSTYSLEVYDFTNPGYPKLHTSFPIGDVNGAMTTAGGRAYLASGNKLYWLDLAGPGTAGPLEESASAAVELRSVAPAVSGNEVFAVTADGHLQGFVGVDTGTLTPSTQFMDGQAVAVSAVGGLVFAARGIGKLRVYETAGRDLGPTIIEINPAVARKGMAVAITGLGFVDGASVTFGAAEASAEVMNPGRIRVRVPPGSGPVKVKVTNPDGRESNAADFTYDNATSPIVTAAVPTSAPMLGGGTVTLHGFGLSGVTDVRVEQAGGAPVTVGIVLGSATENTVAFVVPIAPARQRGPATLVALAGGLEAGIGFSYTADVITGTRGSSLGIRACGGNLYTTGGLKGDDAVTFDLGGLEGDAPALHTIAKFMSDGPFLHCHDGNGITSKKIFDANGVVQGTLPKPIKAHSSVVVGDRLYANNYSNLVTYQLPSLAVLSQMVDTPCWSSGPLRMLAERDRMAIGCDDRTEVYGLTDTGASHLGGTPVDSYCEGSYNGDLVGFEERAVYARRTVWDLSNPAAPQAAKSTGLPPFSCGSEVLWSDDRTQLLTPAGSRLIDVRTRSLAAPYDFELTERILTPVPFGRFLVYGDYLILDNGPTVIRLDGKAAAVSISSLQPPEGPTVGGQTVIIRGHDLDQAYEIQVDGQPLGSFEVISPGALQIVTPPHEAGVVAIEVLSSGAGSASTSYTYSVRAKSVVVNPMFVRPSATVVLEAAPGPDPVTATLNGLPADEIVVTGTTVALKFPRIDLLEPVLLAMSVGAEPVVGLPMVNLAPWSLDLSTDPDARYDQAAFAIDGALLVSGTNNWSWSPTVPTLTLIDASDLEVAAVVADSGVFTTEPLALLAVDGDFALTREAGNLAGYRISTGSLAPLGSELGGASVTELVGSDAISSRGGGISVDAITEEPFELSGRTWDNNYEIYPSAFRWRPGRLFASGWLYSYGPPDGQWPIMAVDLDLGEVASIGAPEGWGKDSQVAPTLGLFGDRLYTVINDTATGTTEFVTLDPTDLTLTIGSTDLAAEPITWSNRGMVRSKLTIGGSERQVVWLAGLNRLLPIDITDPANPSVLAAKALTTSGYSTALLTRDGILFSVEGGRRIRGYPLGTNAVELLGVYPPKGASDERLAISGAGFEPDNLTVKFGTDDAIEVRVIDQNQIICRPPVGLGAGKHVVRVSVGARQSSTLEYEVVP